MNWPIFLQTVGLKHLSEPCSLKVAQAINSLGYSKPTFYVWDRHNPTFRESKTAEAFPVNPCFSSCELCKVARWKLSRSKGSYDNTCCLRAPSEIQARVFLVKSALLGRQL